MILCLDWLKINLFFCLFLYCVESIMTTPPPKFEDVKIILPFLDKPLSAAICLLVWSFVLTLVVTVISPCINPFTKSELLFLSINLVHQCRIHLNTNLLAVAASATRHCTITVCSIYIQPQYQITDTELDQLLQQLPRPYILMSDFNSHNIIWGCKEINKKGKILEKITYKNNLCLLNTDMQTYMNPSSGNTTTVDLSRCDPSICIDFSWKVLEDTCGSDHF